MERIACLMSGGLDSLALLHWLIKLPRPTQITAVHWNYGQSAEQQELRASQAVADFYGAELEVFCFGGGPKFTAGLIHFRNLFLISATALALQRDDLLIGIGVHAGSTYYDCSKAFLDECDTLLSNQTSGKTRLLAPFTEWTKAEIIAYVKKNDLPYHLTYSCETGQQPPCGMCLSCLDRDALC